MLSDSDDAPSRWWMDVAGEDEVSGVFDIFKGTIFVFCCNTS
jgi:hypothetical protein